MFNAFYNFGLLIVLLSALPRLLQKKYRNSLFARMGMRLPPVERKEGPVIWIHAISMGETRAVIPLFQTLSKEFPDATILISNATETGLAEAKKSMSNAAAHFLLPFDFSWVMRKTVNTYRPDLLILVESDFWYNLMRFVKMQEGKVILINGKISERSAGRLSRFRFFANHLFSQVDRYCLQNAHYEKQFIKCGIDPAKCMVTGNIKFDFSPTPLTEEERQKEKEALGILPADRVVVIGSTHPKEEELLIDSLKSVWAAIPAMKVLIVPRHPERFAAVETFLSTTGTPFAVYTKRSQQTGKERIFLMDTMGLLNRCYQLAEVAIVGGSFIQGVGGHNILEPTFAGIPVLFGPNMQSQPDLVALTLNAKTGEQIPIEKLSKTLLALLQDPIRLQEIHTSALALTASIRGSTARTFAEIYKFLKCDCL